MKINFRNSILITLVVSISIMCSAVVSFGLDENVATPEIVVAPSNSLVPNPTPRFTINIDKFVNGNKLRKSTSLPEKYDLRELGLVTPVKNQGAFGTCWSFAACSSAESSMIKQGFADINADYSEAHLVNVMYNRQNDPLGNTDGDGQKILNGNSAANFGGDDNKTLIALSGWTGIADEAIMPYGDILKTLDPTLAYRNTAIIENGYIIPNDISTVKQAVIDYGALNIAYYADGKYYGDDGKSYYCNEVEIANHEVSLIGWDDTYSKENFTGITKPDVDGAWIIKNSWGNQEGDDGYIYLSYGDKSLTDIIAYQFQPQSEYDHNYYYDGNSVPALSCSPISTAKMANVYTAKGNMPSGIELIKAVGLVSYCPGATYKVQIYRNPTNSTDPESGTPLLSKESTGTIKGAGFTTIKLDDQPTIQDGDKFSVVIELSDLTYDVKSKSYNNFGVEMAYEFKDLSFMASINPNQSFSFENGDWIDLEEGDVCARIKAFTVDVTNQFQEVELSSTSGTYTGTEQKPDVIKVVADGKVVDNSKYKVEYEGDFTNAGDHKVIVTGKDEYTGVIVKTFTINKATATLSFASSSLTKTYGNIAFTNALTYNCDGIVTYKSSDKSVATVNTSGKVTLVGVGKATITATTVGTNYTTATASYTVTVKAPVLKATSSISNTLYGYDDVKASWKAVSGASGYFVYYRKSTASSYTYKSYTAGTSMKIENLADGAKYYVKIIPYKSINGTKYKGTSKTSSAIYTLKKLSTPKLSKKSSSKVTVKWTNISGESGYQISKSTSKSKTGTIYTVKTTTGKSKVISTTKGKKYYYKVRAYKNVGTKKIYGPWSNLVVYKLK